MSTVYIPTTSVGWADTTNIPTTFVGTAIPTKLLETVYFGKSCGGHLTFQFETSGQIFKKGWGYHKKF